MLDALMIVTKEMTQKYLIRRACYLISKSRDGDFMLTATSVHWKEGMELFESYDECVAEINRRKQELMDSGNCPRCHYQFTYQTKKDLTNLHKLNETKGSVLYECQSCHSVWYKHPDYDFAAGYHSSMKDYVLEWSTRQLDPTSEMQKALDSIGNISDDSKLMIYPAEVLLKDGKEFQPGLIILGNLPPTQEEFNQRGWHYLDSVKSIKPSALAYNQDVCRSIVELQRSSDWVYIKSDQTKKVYSFSAHTGMFMPEELKGQTFKIVTNKKEQYGTLSYYIPAERGGPDEWTMKETRWEKILGTRQGI